MIFQCLLGALGTYVAMLRLLGEDLWLASGYGEVSLRDLEDLSVVQFAIIVAMTDCLESSLLSGFGVTLLNRGKDLQCKLVLRCIRL